MYQTQQLSLFESIATEEKEYLQTWMNNVSRSFSLVVSFLEEPLNYYMSAAYLICRVVDNIEDCTQPFSWKKQRFAEYRQLLVEPASASDLLNRWDALVWPGLTDTEQKLMGSEHGLPLYRFYARIPENERSSIRRWTLAMAQGMCAMIDPEQTPELLRRGNVAILKDVDDYNQYCFFVAGTVGHMITELVIDHYRLSDEVSYQLLQGCEACGRGLQKTNIIKDFAKDVERGISYLPATWLEEAGDTPLILASASLTWKYKVIHDIVMELREATDYLLALPYGAAGYRMSSLLALLPAYQTLLLAAKKRDILFTPSHVVKISRPTMAKCKWDAKAMLADNEAIRRYSSRIEAKIDAEFGLE